MNKPNLEGKQIVVAIDGGPETYLAADMIRRLIRAGAVVKTALTKDAQEWITPLSFSTLSGFECALAQDEGIELSKNADAVIAMTSGLNFVPSIAAGKASDAACAALLSCERGIILPGESLPSFPWFKTLLSALSEDYTLLESGYYPEETIEILSRLAGPSDLSGKRILITAGPTREYIDPVRFITNPSTGLMGIELAEAASMRGAEITLLLGPTSLHPPPGLKTFRFETADELWSLADRYSWDADVVIASAAVGDYTPVAPEENKIKKNEKNLCLELKRTPDILGRLGKRFMPGKGNNPSKRPFMVGFAAETENLVSNARAKLNSKHLDLVVANEVGKNKNPFGSPDNEVVFISKNNQEQLSLTSKRIIADLILDRVLEMSERRTC